jgi:hypothetical protein
MKSGGNAGEGIRCIRAGSGRRCPASRVWNETLMTVWEIRGHAWHHPMLHQRSIGGTCSAHVSAPT